MQSHVALIPTRSRRQAMDLSVVLLSQGIESVIEQDPNDQAWGLVVRASEYERAVSTLEQYRAENKRPFWQQNVPGSDLLFDGASFLWLVLLVLVYALSTTRMPILREAGVMDGALVLQGEWWRLFTAILLHADLPHLLANLTTGLLLLGLAMGSFGGGHALLASFLSGALANLTALALDPDHRNLGASGMIMAALGLLTAHSVSLWRAGLQLGKAIRRAFLGGLLLLVLFGFNPESDVVAHVAGFFVGLIFGIGLAWLPEPRLRNPISNRLAEALCAGLVALTWWLALRNA